MVKKTKLIVLAIYLVLIAILQVNIGIAVSQDRADSKGIEITGYGIYIPEPEARQANEKILTGRSSAIKKKVLSEKTERIPALPGTNFGFTFIITENPEGLKKDIIKRIIFPPMKDMQDNTTQTTSEWVSTVETGKTAHIGYSFDRETEIKEGEWIFQIISDGKIIAEKTFIVFKP